MEIDLDAIDPVEESIPTGRYLAELVNVKKEFYKYMEGSKVVWHWCIVKGREEGKEILSSSPLDQEDNYRLYKHLLALGVRGKVKNLDPMTLLRRKAVLEIENERNVPNVKRVFPPIVTLGVGKGKK